VAWKLFMECLANADRRIVVLGQSDWVGCMGVPSINKAI